MTSPPRPPFPPSGPPRGLNFSRRTEATPFAAVAAGHVQHDTVDEGGHPVPPRVGGRVRKTGADGTCRPPPPEALRCVAQASAATTLTVLRPRLVPNSTAPVARANRVSSLPRPTLSPGWNFVPRWRTRISPALTNWPPKRLTPRRCALESRPFRVELSPFFVAIVKPAFVWCGRGRSEEHTSELQSRGH